MLKNISDVVLDFLNWVRDQSISGFGRHQGALIGLHSKILSLSKFIYSNSGFTLKPNGGFNVEVGISLTYSSENGKLNIL